jgi:hypothetical protein
VGMRMRRRGRHHEPRRCRQTEEKQTTNHRFARQTPPTRQVPRALAARYHGLRRNGGAKISRSRQSNDDSLGRVGKRRGSAGFWSRVIPQEPGESPGNQRPPVVWDARKLFPEPRWSLADSSVIVQGRPDRRRQLPPGLSHPAPSKRRDDLPPPYHVRRPTGAPKLGKEH